MLTLFFGVIKLGFPLFHSSEGPLLLLLPLLSLLPLLVCCRGAHTAVSPARRLIDSGAASTHVTESCFLCMIREAPVHVAFSSGVDFGPGNTMTPTTVGERTVFFFFCVVGTAVSQG